MSLTSRIQALTAYANEVTGESDTTLADAVATLADGYGQGGEEVYTTSNGLIYTPIMTIPDSSASWGQNLAYMFKNATNLIEFTSNRQPANGYQFTQTFDGCANLKKITLSKATAMQGGNTHTFGGCASLESLTLGSVGYAFTAFAINTANSSQSNVVVNIYVNKGTKAEAEALGFEGDVRTVFPNAAFNYYSSTTGEVLS